MPPQVSPDTIMLLKGALEEYRRAVEKARLSGGTKATYIRGASQFVRWLNGEFAPRA